MALVNRFTGKRPTFQTLVGSGTYIPASDVKWFKARILGGGAGGGGEGQKESGGEAT